MENEIKKALENNVDLSKEEYAELNKKSDVSTKSHGVEGRAPISEALRHKRIQTNYYGSSLNVGMQTLAALSNIETLLGLIAKKLYSEEIEDNGGRKQD